MLPRVSKILVYFLIFTLVFSFTFFLVPPKSASAAISLVQKAKNTGTNTSVSATWDSATTTGNFLVAVVRGAQGASGSTTITPPTGWTQAVTTGAFGTCCTIQIFYKENAASQTSTGNFTMDSGQQAMQLIVAEYSGVSTSSSLDKTASNKDDSGSNNSPSTGTTATTTQADELLIGGLGAFGGVTYSSPTNSFTIQDTLNNSAFLDRIVSSTGAYSTGATQSINTQWGGAIATFKSSSNTAPSITAGPSDGGSSSTSPTTVGSNVTFTATATDAESDNYYLAICKTNSVTAVNSAAPTCGGGSWAISSATTSGSQASVTYTTTASDSGSQAWFAFVCDNNSSSLCSSSSQGSGDNGSPFVVNAAPSITAGPSDGGSSSSTATTAGSNVTFTATATDTESDNYYLAICKTNSVTANNSAAPTCGGGSWAISSSTSSGSQASVTYTTTSSDTGSKAWFAFVCDNNASSLCSSSSQSSGDNGSPFVVVVSTPPPTGGGPGGGIGQDPAPPGTTGITVNKTAIGGDATFSFTTTGAGYTNFSITTKNGSGSNKQHSLSPGTYSVKEELPSGWAMDTEKSGCDNGKLDAIVVVGKQITTCTITNVKAKPKQGTILVTKNTVNGDGTFNFNIKSIEGPAYSGQFTITTSGGSGSASTAGLAPGKYEVKEVLSKTQINQGWSITSDSCANVSVSANQIATCSVTNTKSSLPTITSLSPSSKAVNSSQFTLTVNGTNFIKTSKVRFNGQDRTTIFVSATKLTATIPASDLIKVGIYPITVFNPGANGGTSNSTAFTVTNPLPTITSLNPSSTTAGSQDIILTVNGTNFIISSIVKFNGQNRSTTFVSVNKLTASILASDLEKAGNFQVTVFNPGSGGGTTSNPQTFTVNNPLPTITSIDPAQKALNSPQFTLTVNGTNFVSGSVVRFNDSDRTTTFVSSTQLTALIPDADLKALNTFNVTVFNPLPGGGTSNIRTFQVGNPIPLITDIVPSAVNVDDDPFTLTVNGYDFVQGATIQFNNLSLSTIFNSSAKLESSLKLGPLAEGTYSISVTNPIPGGGTSNSLTLVVGAKVEEVKVTVPPLEVGIISQLIENVIDTISQAAENVVAIATTVAESVLNPIRSLIEDVQVVANYVKEAIGPVIEPVIENTKVVVQFTKEIVETPVGSVATKAITTTGIAIATTAVVLTPAFSLSEIFLTPIRLWGLLLSLLGIRKKSLPWGVVYDSQTKQPLDPAYVILRDQKGKVIAKAITDLDGRYGFLVEPGNYTISASKTNYQFPSKKLSGLNDEVYDNLYFGEKITITKKGQVISKNIPLDPLKFDWNEFAKKNKNFMRFYSKWDVIIRKISDPSFMVGFTLSTLVLILVPRPYNIIIFSLYIFILLLKAAMKALGLKPKAIGYVREKKTGLPLSFALLRVVIPSSNTEISHKVSDKYGRYYCLVPKGRYYVKIEKKQDDGSYTLIHTSPVIDASRKGIIKERFEV